MLSEFDQLLSLLRELRQHTCMLLFKVYNTLYLHRPGCLLSDKTTVSQCSPGCCQEKHCGQYGSKQAGITQTMNADALTKRIWASLPYR